MTTVDHAGTNPAIPGLAAVGHRPWRTFFTRPVTLVYLGVLLALTLFCFVGPFFGRNPIATDAPVMLPPSTEFPAGTNSLGQDMLARMMVGGQASLLVGLWVAVLSMVLAVGIGAIAGFFGGLADTLLTKITEFFQVVPALVLALVAVAIVGTGLPLIIAVLSLTMWPPTARIMRAECMRLASAGYVESARAAGFSTSRILWSDVIPNAMAPVIVSTTMTVGRAILAESALAFLGLGDPSRPSWGTLLYEAQSYLQFAWWLTVFPGAAIFITVLAANMLGDALNDSLNPTIGKVKQ